MPFSRVKRKGLTQVYTSTYDEIIFALKDVFPCTVDREAGAELKPRKRREDDGVPGPFIQHYARRYLSVWKQQWNKYITVDLEQ